jgi:nucleotide-binding universal stress UspA family protein
MERRHILAPTDFSDPSPQAIAYAFELAQRLRAKLSLLHVIELPVLAIEVYLVSGNERTHEIGIRMAVGAKRR